MLNLAQITARLWATCFAAGGVAAFCRDTGLTRNNVENMSKGRLKPSPGVCAALGVRRVVLELYLEPGEELPAELAPYVVERKPIPGRLPA